MILRRKALLYDIANMAYTIADTGEHTRHTLHRVRDICQDGNIDRVNRILALTFSKVLTVLLPVLKPPRRLKSLPCGEDSEKDFPIHLRKDGNMKFIITQEIEMNIKETVHEYMVCMVLGDWLAITLPEAADVWRYRAEKALQTLLDLATSLTLSSSRTLRRQLSPF